MNSFEEHQYLCQVYHPASSKLLRKYEKSSPPSNLPSVSVFQTSTSQILQVLLNHTTNPRLFDMYYKATNTIIMCSAVRCRKDRWHLWVKTEWGRHLWVRPSPFLLILFVLFVRLYVHCSAMQKKETPLSEIFFHSVIPSITQGRAATYLFFFFFFALFPFRPLSLPTHFSRIDKMLLCLYHPSCSVLDKYKSVCLLFLCECVW